MAINVVDSMNSKFLVTIVGYGKYGRLISNKYLNTASFNNISILHSVIEPSFDNQEKLRDAQLHCGKISFFLSFEEWYSSYWLSLSTRNKRMTVLDFAVKPQILCNVLSKYLMSCQHLRWIILPKPVCMTYTELQCIISLLKRYEIRCPISSQWAYSPLPKEIQSYVEKKCGSDLKLIEINFSKENGRAYDTPPPLLEMPHCIQLLQSSGLVDFSSTRSSNSPAERKVGGSRDHVTVQYTLQNKTCIYIYSSVDYHPSACEKSHGDNTSRPSYQLRTLRAMDKIQNELFFVDFWIHFDKYGEKVLRKGEIKLSKTKPLEEDQLLIMLQKMYHCMADHLNDDVEEFDNDVRACSLSGSYFPVCKEIVDIQFEWDHLFKP